MLLKFSCVFVVVSSHAPPFECHLPASWLPDPVDFSGSNVDHSSNFFHASTPLVRTDHFPFEHPSKSSWDESFIAVMFVGSSKTKPIWCLFCCSFAGELLICLTNEQLTDNCQCAFGSCIVWVPHMNITRWHDMPSTESIAQPALLLINEPRFCSDIQP